MGLLTQAIGENNLACLHVLSSAIIRHLGKRVNEFCIKIPQEDLGMRGKNLWITKHAKHATRKAAKGNQAPFRGFRSFRWFRDPNALRFYNSPANARCGNA